MTIATARDGGVRPRVRRSRPAALLPRPRRAKPLTGAASRSAPPARRRWTALPLPAAWRLHLGAPRRDHGRHGRVGVGVHCLRAPRFRPRPFRCRAPCRRRAAAARTRRWPLPAAPDDRGSRSGRGPRRPSPRPSRGTRRFLDRALFTAHARGRRRRPRLRLHRDGHDRHDRHARCSPRLRRRCAALTALAASAAARLARRPSRPRSPRLRARIAAPTAGAAIAASFATLTRLARRGRHARQLSRRP